MAAPDNLEPPLKILIDRAAVGDRAAFESIYNRFAGRIRAFALARGSDDAEGLANDVMLRVFQNLATFHGSEAAFVRWIFTIARNRLIDLHRQATRRPQIVDTPVPDRVFPSAEAMAFELFSVDDVVSRLNLLTVEQREVIALRLIEDLSLADVAEIVGRPVTAVKALQRRGLRQLQRQIMNEVVS